MAAGWNTSVAGPGGISSGRSCSGAVQVRPFAGYRRCRGKAGITQPHPITQREEYFGP